MERDYKHGFKTDVTTLKDTGKGVTEETVRQISEIKNEPE
jgi:Fe-S cluster assembly protein SufB